MPIQQLSVQSLLLTLLCNGHAIGTATGFVVKKGDDSYLITNWHVLAGRHPETGQPVHNQGAIPDALQVAYFLPPGNGRLEWNMRQEELLDKDGNPLWLEHPVYGRKVDVVALPLKNVEGAELIPYSLEDEEVRLRVIPSDTLNIIGFPFGVSAGGAVAIWVRGALASEPDMDFKELPSFLVDARTRQGQSGSPVVAFAAGSGAMENGSTAFFDGFRIRLMGVYSGRIVNKDRPNESSDLGYVWKVDAVKAILEGGKAGDNTLEG